jgi:hypothetical protein
LSFIGRSDVVATLYGIALTPPQTLFAMMSFFTRMLDLFGTGGNGSVQSAELASAEPAEQLPPAPLSELEFTILQQRKQIDRAVSLLQDAAFLAGYHQPPLQRDIRSFLAEVKGSGNEPAAPGTSISQTGWPAPAAGHHLAA